MISPPEYLVDLEPGQYVDLEFIVSGLAPGTYEVQCDGLSASLLVTGTAQAGFGTLGALAIGAVALGLLLSKKKI